MNKTISFALENAQHINFEDYEDDEFAIARMGFLASRPNRHGLEISDEVLKKCAPTVLGKWVVSKYNFAKSDLEGHEPTEQIMGIVPKDQEVEFAEEDDYLRAYVNVVISKIYAKEFCSILNRDESHAVSVEMKVSTENGKVMNDVVNSFNIVGVTVLGTTIRPSVPNSDIEFVRFAEDAEIYFGERHLTTMQKNEQEEKVDMEDKKNYVDHPINTSKKAVYDGEWDGNKAKQDLVKEKDYKELAPKVCLRLEEGWEDRQVTKLGYPVMGIHDGEWVYFKKALSSALGYAKQENDEEIVNKIKKIYKNLGIDDEGKEGESKMAEIEFAAVDIGDMWGKLWDALHAKYPDGDYDSVYRVDGIYEESNKKFAIIRHRDEDVLYRLDFSLTEAGIKLADEIVKVEIDIVETDEIRKFAEPENVEEYRTFAEDSTEEKVEEKEESEAKLEETKEEKVEEMSEEKAEMSAEELTAKVAQLEADITERDNIIMEKDAELTELRAYKESCMSIERATKVETVMSEVAKFMDEITAEGFRSKGMDCAFSEIDAWANEVKASVVDKVTKSAKQTNNDDFTRMSAIENIRPDAKSGSALERLKVKFCN